MAAAVKGFSNVWRPRGGHNSGATDWMKISERAEESVFERTSRELKKKQLE